VRSAAGPPDDPQPQPRGTHRPRPRHPVNWSNAAGLAAGVALDALLGDPRRGHPVALFGRAAQAAESRLYADDRLRGTAYTAACVLSATIPAVIACHNTRGWSRFTVTVLAAWTVIGAKSLAKHAQQIAAALEAGDLAEARRLLPSMCGRDPAGLDAAGIARAVVESVAENTSDAVVAPLVWGAVAGLPGLAAYRAANTLDAMVGYRSPRYARFGWAAARLDDLANWVPARLTGLLAAACAPAAGGQAATALHALRRYGGRHPSPNAGRCEAAFAGALGVRLGGTNVYAGHTEHRPALGDGRAPDAHDIRRAVRLSRTVTIVATLACALAALPSHPTAPRAPVSLPPRQTPRRAPA
jgi:adenosylcobinamide-phosphate synthase